MPRAGNQARSAYLQFSQVWFPTVQDVLQADWQDVWHSLHPPFFIVSFKLLPVNVLICFILITSCLNFAMCSLKISRAHYSTIKPSISKPFHNFNYFFSAWMFFYGFLPVFPVVQLKMLPAAPPAIQMPKITTIFRIPLLPGPVVS